MYHHTYCLLLRSKAYFLTFCQKGDVWSGPNQCSWFFISFPSPGKMSLGWGLALIREDVPRVTPVIWINRCPNAPDSHSRVMNFPYTRDINKSTQVSLNICMVSCFTSGLLVRLEFILVNGKTSNGPGFLDKVAPWNCGGNECQSLRCRPLGGGPSGSFLQKFGKKPSLQKIKEMALGGTD